MREQVFNKPNEQSVKVESYDEDDEELINMDRQRQQNTI